MGRRPDDAYVTDDADRGHPESPAVQFPSLPSRSLALPPRPVPFLLLSFSPSFPLAMSIVATADRRRPCQQAYCQALSPALTVLPG